MADIYLNNNGKRYRSQLIQLVKKKSSFGLHILIQNRTKKPLCNGFKWGGEGVKVERQWR
jgi:hypothetical protein